jgi:taurine dioxygenase
MRGFPVNASSTNQVFFNSEPLDRNLPFGVVVRDLAPASLADEDVRQALRDIWIREGLVIFKGIADPAVHLQLSEVFGPGVDHPAREARTEQKGLINVIYDPQDPYLVEMGNELRGKPLPWHSDLIYAPEVNHGGILRAVTLPSKWGETGFIDQIAAYDTLPEALKAQLDGLHVVYEYDVDVGNQRFGITLPMKVKQWQARMLSIQNRKGDFPQVIHPLTYVQVQTGRTVLNLSPWFAVGIHEMPNAAGDALLEDIARHIVDHAPSYMHSWDLEDMVLWDNWRMLHCAAGAPANEVRHMVRTTIGGDHGLGRVASGAGASASYAVV